MGGGPVDRVLCILPNPEPKEILDKLRASHPGIEIKYIQRQWRQVGMERTEIPEGKLLTLRQLKRLRFTASIDVYQDISVLFTLGDLPKSREHAPNLKYVHLYSAGADRVVSHPLFLETDIIFTNSSGVHGPQISEWVIMTALVHNHKYNFTYESQKLHKWDRSPAFNIRDFAGQRLAVLGYGAIGRQGEYSYQGLPIIHKT
jgi:phosphoglycerate dehydrogenase-like enzyme